MFIKIGDRIVNLDRVHSAHLRPAGDCDEATLTVDHHDVETPDGVASVMRFEGEEAEAVRRYFTRPNSGAYTEDLMKQFRYSPG